MNSSYFIIDIIKVFIMVILVLITSIDISSYIERKEKRLTDKQAGS